jgi:ABC-2 type transport system permease protein
VSSATEATVGRSPRPQRRLPGLVLHQTRYEMLAFLRNRQARFFTLALPVMFLVIFVGVFGNDTLGPQHVKAATYYVPGICALGVISASFTNIVIGVVTQRELGVFKRLRATPVPAWVLIIGRTLTAVATSAIVVTVLIAIGRVAYGVRLPTSTLPGVALTALVGAAAFACLAYATSTLISTTESAQPVVLALTLPLYFISGVFIPSIRLPHWLHVTAQIFPVEHLAAALHVAFDPATTGTGISWRDLAVLGAWGVGGLVVATRRFGWGPTNNGR